VDRVEVRTYRVGVEQCGFNDPVNGTQAAFSTPYVVACALRDGWVSPEHFTGEAVLDPQLTALQRRVRVVVDEELEARFPDVWPARVCVTTTSGDRLEAQVDVALGDPAVPMSPGQIEAKVASCLRRPVGDAEVTTLSEQVLELPAAGPGADLWQTLDHWALDPQHAGAG
jgi:2-methylcitrate dehydratase PrpD